MTAIAHNTPIIAGSTYVLSGSGSLTAGNKKKIKLISLGSLSPGQEEQKNEDWFCQSLFKSQPSAIDLTLFANHCSNIGKGFSNRGVMCMYMERMTKRKDF